MSKLVAKTQVFLSGLKKEEGATAVEYALLVAGIAVVIVGAIGLFGGALSTFFTNLKTSLGL